MIDGEVKGDMHSARDDSHDDHGVSAINIAVLFSCQGHDDGHARMVYHVSFVTRE